MHDHYALYKSDQHNINNMKEYEKYDPKPIPIYTGILLLLD